MTKLGTDVATHLPRELGTDVGGAAGPTPVLYGLQSFAAGNYYLTANPGGIAGIATGFWISTLLRIDTQAITSSTRLPAARCNATVTTGWEVITLTTNANIGFCVGDGTTPRCSPSFTITAADVGKVLHVVGVFDGATVRQYVNRAQAGGSTAAPAYVVEPGPTYLGRRASGGGFASATVFGLCGGLGIPTLAEIQAQADAIKLAYDIVEIPGKTSSLWSPKQDQVGGVAPAVLKDKKGSEDMTRVGSPVLVQEPAPVWGW